MRLYHHLHRATVLLLAGSLLLGGCLPPAQPRVIKIALVAPFEGRDRAIGYDAIYGARLAVQEFNAAGGIQLELVSYDDRGEVELAQTLARDVSADPEVMAVIGNFRPATTEAAAPIYAEAGVALVSVGGGAVAGGATTRVLAPQPAILAREIVTRAATGGRTTLAIWGQGAMAESLRAAVTEAGLFIGTASTPAQGMPLPEGILNTRPALEAGEDLSLWRNAGWNGVLVGGPELADAAFGTAAGASAEWTCFVTPYPFPQDLAGLEGWIADYKAMGPHVPEPGPYALPAYMAVKALGEAVKAADGGDREAVANALGQVRFDGPTGTLSWDTAGFWSGAPLYYYCWEQGKPRLRTILSWSPDQDEVYPVG